MGGWGSHAGCGVVRFLSVGSAVGWSVGVCLSGWCFVVFALAAAARLLLPALRLLLTRLQRG